MQGSQGREWEAGYGRVTMAVRAGIHLHRSHATGPEAVLNPREIKHNWIYVTFLIVINVSKWSLFSFI